MGVSLTSRPPFSAVLVSETIALRDLRFERKRSKMGKRFGNLTTVRGIIHYSLSPFEQRAFAGVISHGIPNILRRIRSQMFRVAPPFIIGYLIYDWGEKENARLSRKNPADYANDE
ncbi:cytochrome b-c1 complex subunit 8-like [Lineus longissimus]|uniref:cytochrome b-c1 complex subunit 8-like n=1 Tax=Lineus longissimus TaxID=88925 RepID=UPI002B4D668C